MIIIYALFPFAIGLFILNCGIGNNTSQKIIPDNIAFGEHTQGGYNGQIIRVTTLDARGPGSLLEAIETKGPRMILFKVGGIIDLNKSHLVITKPYLTIAGQSRKSGWEPDGLATSGGNAYQIIIDHCSFTWAVDENLSASGTRTEGPDSTSHRITFSNNIIAEGLDNSSHQKDSHSKGTLIHDFPQVPDHVLNIALHTNYSSSEVGTKVNRISDILLNLETEDDETGLIRDSDISSIELSNEEMERFCGYYWNEKSRYSRKINLKDDTHRYFRTESSESKSLPVGENAFQMLDVESVVRLNFEISRDGQKVMLVHVGEDDLEGELGVFSGIRVKRDKKKRILGLSVSNGHVRNLWFEKL
jgi:hypothetical protein